MVSSGASWKPLIQALKERKKILSNEEAVFVRLSYSLLL
jgi:hypothetical protein